MKARISITAQVQENYGTKEVAFWKNKGGREIITEIDLNLLQDTHPAIIKSAVETLLEVGSNSKVRYLYLCHSTDTVEPLVVEGMILEDLIKREVIGEREG
jgi:hypothetical protein